MIVQNKEVASLLLLEWAYNHKNIEVQPSESPASEISAKSDPYLSRIEEYISANRKTLLSWQKSVIRYLRDTFR